MDKAETLWTAPVAGKVYGLAVADGRLIASTDRGELIAYAPAAEAPATPVAHDPGTALLSATPPAEADAACQGAGRCGHG